MYTIKDFSDDISKIAEQNSINQRPLEEYLRTLWAIACEHQDETLFPEIVLQMLKEAYVQEPAAIESNWLNLTAMPNWNHKDEKYVIEAFVDRKLVIVEDNVADFEVFRRAIQFQIADLNRFAPSVFSDPYGYFGVDSPTGNRWFNFHVDTYLNCAASFLSSGRDAGTVLFNEIDWVDVSWILKAGMSYE